MLNNWVNQEMGNKSPFYGFLDLCDGGLFMSAEKRIIVDDQTGIKQEPLQTARLSAKKPNISNAPREAFKSPPKRTWKKMTVRKFITEKLQGTTMDVRDLADLYKEEGHSSKPVKKIMANMSAVISMMRKEGFPLVKIKRGRYGIRN